MHASKGSNIVIMKVGEGVEARENASNDSRKLPIVSKDDKL